MNPLPQNYRGVVQAEQHDGKILVTATWVDRWVQYIQELCVLPVWNEEEMK